MAERTSNKTIQQLANLVKGSYLLQESEVQMLEQAVHLVIDSLYDMYLEQEKSYLQRQVTKLKAMINAELAESQGAANMIAAFEKRLAELDSFSKNNNG